MLAEKQEGQEEAQEALWRQQEGPEDQVALSWAATLEKVKQYQIVSSIKTIVYEEVPGGPGGPRLGGGPGGRDAFGGPGGPGGRTACVIDTIIKKNTATTIFSRCKFNIF